MKYLDRVFVEEKAVGEEEEEVLGFLAVDLLEIRFVVVAVVEFAVAIVAAIAAAVAAVVVVVAAAYEGNYCYWQR